MTTQTTSPADDEERKPEGGAANFSFSGTGNGDHVTIKGIGVLGLGAFGKPFGGAATGAGGVIGIGGYPGYPYDPQTPYIPWAPPHQPGIVFPPQPQQAPHITPNDVVKGEFVMTDEERETLVKAITEMFEKAKKEVEEDMVQKDESRTYVDKIVVPDPEASDRVYKIPYASGGLVGHPKVPTALHGLFYAMWIFASWVTLKPAILTVAAAKTAWKVPVAISRGFKHAFLVTLPPVTLFTLAFACITGPRWVEPMMDWGGWGYNRHGDWFGFGLFFVLTLLGSTIWTIFHFVHRGVEGYWWWQEEK